MGWARGAESGAEQERFEAQRGILESAEGIFTGPRQGPNGFIFHLGDRDRGESPRACQPGQLHGVSPVRFDAITRFVGNQGGGDNPTGVALGGQIPVEPRATRPRCRDEDEVGGF